MMPKLKRRTQHTFDRIGDCYAPYIDSEHFMGISALNDNWRKYNAPVNVIHKKDKSIVEVALPGFSKDQIELYYDDDTVHLHAVHPTPKNGKRSIQQGQIKDNIHRAFSLPPHAIVNRIKANYKEG